MFQPPGGDYASSDPSGPGSSARPPRSLRPLAGVTPLLTCAKRTTGIQSAGSQPPGGDYASSDDGIVKTIDWTIVSQPPNGDCLSSDRSQRPYLRRPQDHVSAPLAGIPPLLTWPTA